MTYEPPVDPGEALRTAMANRGVTSADLTGLTGARPNTVSNWRRRGVSKAHAKVVGDFLGVDPRLITYARGADYGDRAARVQVVQESASHKPDSAHWGDRPLAELSREELVERIQSLMSQVRVSESQVEQANRAIEQAQRMGMVLEPHLQRFIRTLGDADLPPHHVRLLEELVYALSRR